MILGRELRLVRAGTFAPATWGQAGHLRGDLEEDYSVRFRAPSNVVKATHNDMQDATEDGAAAVAIATVVDLTEYVVVSRSKKGTGIDYWLGSDADDPFEARLEVSGILVGDVRGVESRLKSKVKQMTRSDAGGLPGYAVVVEFGLPAVRVRKK